NNCKWPQPRKPRGPFRKSGSFPSIQRELNHRQPSGLLGDFQCGLEALGRIGSDPQGDFCRLNSKLLLVIPNCESIRTKQKSYFSRLSISKGNALKLSQGPDRLGNACSLETEIALHRFHSWVRAGVGDIGASAQGRALSCLAPQQIFIQALGADLRLVNVE